MFLNGFFHISRELAESNAFTLGIERTFKCYFKFYTRGVGLKVLSGQGAMVDTTTPSGQLALGIFAALAEFEHELRVERITAGMTAARARGRKGGRPPVTVAKLRTAMAAMVPSAMLRGAI
jgi:Resolvase, N terminal domain